MNGRRDLTENFPDSRKRGIAKSERVWRLFLLAEIILLENHKKKRILPAVLSFLRKCQKGITSLPRKPLNALQSGRNGNVVAG